MATRNGSLFFASIIQQDMQVPEDFTFRHILYSCYAIHQWEWMEQPVDGPYKHGYFYNKIEDILSGLSHISRKTALRHQHTSTCITCEESVDLTRTTLDHIMPLAKGGPDNLDNALVLCRKHNSSKGKKDLLDWWMEKEWNPADLSRDVLCLYARIHWQHAPQEWLKTTSTTNQRHFIAARARTLPTPRHHIALYGSTYAGCSLSAWLRGYAPRD